VFDPFAGLGTTLAVAERMGRNVLGLELLPERVDFIRRRLRNPATIPEGDALRSVELDLPVIDLVMTSPPYMNRLNHPENPLTGYRTLDGNYERYLTQVGDVFRTLRQRLRAGGKICYQRGEHCQFSCNHVSVGRRGRVGEELALRA